MSEKYNYQQSRPAQTFPPQSRPIPPQDPNYTAPFKFGQNPQSAMCSSCNSSVVTVTKTVSGLLTWLLVGAIALVGCFCGCCLIPLCIKDAKDVEHYW